MKRKISVLFFAFALLFAAISSAVETKWAGRSVDIAKHSLQSGNATITTGAGLFYGIVVRTDGTNDVTLNVYDNNAATVSGTRLTPASIVIDGASYASGWAYSLDPAITYTTGIRVGVTVAGGGTCAYDVLYYTLP